MARQKVYNKLEIKAPLESKGHSSLVKAPELPFYDDLESVLSWVETTARFDMESSNPVAVSTKQLIDQRAEQEKPNVPFIMRDFLVPTKKA